MRLHSSAKNSQSPVMNLQQETMTQVSTVVPPTYPQLQTLFVSSAIPMVAFGFMDNMIMIQAGSYIDATFGATLGMATLAAAAMGQVVSDVSGVIFGSTVERLFQRFGFTRPPCLTNAQRQLPIVRNVTMVAMVVGVTVGCLLGASTLLFTDLHAHERQNRTAQLKDVISDMIEDEELTSKCQECRVHIMTTGTFDKYDNKSSGPRIFLLSGGTPEKCANDRITIEEGYHLFVPIMSHNEVMGVLEIISDSFSPEDKRITQVIARHIGIFMEHLSMSK
jgi:Transmembrane protein 65